VRGLLGPRSDPTSAAGPESLCLPGAPCVPIGAKLMRRVRNECEQQVLRNISSIRREVGVSDGAHQALVLPQLTLRVLELN
jgi:hypothetical protein